MNITRTDTPGSPPELITLRARLLELVIEERRTDIHLRKVEAYTEVGVVGLAILALIALPVMTFLGSVPPPASIVCALTAAAVGGNKLRKVVRPRSGERRQEPDIL